MGNGLRCLGISPSRLCWRRFAIGTGYERRVRLPDGSPDEAILSADEAEGLFEQTTTGAVKIPPAEADKLRLLVSRRASGWPTRTIAISPSACLAFARISTN